MSPSYTCLIVSEDDFFLKVTLSSSAPSGAPSGPLFNELFCTPLCLNECTKK